MGENGSVFRVAYYEAGDRRLARAGATLSRRMENGGGIWRLELPRAGGERLELEQAGDPAAPPERMAGVLSAFLRGTEPEPVVRLQVARDDGELRAKLLEGLQAGELGRVACSLAEDPRAVKLGIRRGPVEPPGLLA